jgi:hypothetical protein
MPSINNDQLYPYADQYWSIVKKTYEEVFYINPDNIPDVVRRTDALRSVISRRPPQEQILFYHREPLSVAADIIGEQISQNHIKKYLNLPDMWWTETRIRNYEIPEKLEKPFLG